MLSGTLEERIDGYRKLLNDPEWLKKVAWFQTDVMPPTEPVQTVQKVFCINK